MQIFKKHLKSHLWNLKCSIKKTCSENVNGNVYKTFTKVYMDKLYM